MSKHRTKAQKIKVAKYRQEVEPELAANIQSSSHLSPSTGLVWNNSAQKTDQTVKIQSQQLPKSEMFVWRFNPKLIYQDLFKTALASALIVGILLLIYYLSFKG